MSGLRSRLAALERKVGALPGAASVPPAAELGPDYIPLAEWTDEELAAAIAFLEQNPGAKLPIYPALRPGAVRPAKPVEPRKIPDSELSDEQLRWLIYTHARYTRLKAAPRA